MTNLTRGITLGALAWGWDLENAKLIKDPHKT